MLAPQYLINNIPTISLIVSAVVLVLTTNYMDKKIVFPLADGVKAHARRRIRKHNALTNLFSEALATIIFLLYVYFLTDVVSKYIFQPILTGMKDFILIVIIVLFLGVNYIINNKEIRRRFLHC